MWFGTSRSKCAIPKKSLARMLWFSFFQRTMKPASVSQLPPVRTYTAKHPSFIWYVWWPRVSSDVSATVRSGWGPGKQTFRFEVSRMKREISNQNSSSQAIALLRLTNDQCCWIYQLPRKYTGKTPSFLPASVEWYKFNSHIDGCPS